MGKKSRLIKKLDAEAAAETEARKQRDLAEGKYTVDPNTGKPVGEVNTPSTKVQMVETNSLPGFEGTSRVVTTNTKTPLADPSESFKGDRRYLDAVDIQNKRQDIANVDFSNPAQMQKAGLSLTFTPGQIDASIADYESTIAQKENAELAIKNDGILAKQEALKANDPISAAAAEDVTNQLLQNNSNLGLETVESRKPSVFETALNTENPDWVTEPTVKDIQEGMDEIDYETQYGMTPEAQEKINAIQKWINSGRIRTSEPAIEKLGLTDYYPDMGQPLQVGTYSGSIVGSNPIFTAKGAVFPQAVYDARKRALQNEALKKKQQQQKLLELATVAAAPQYKQDLDNMQFSNIQQAMASVGGNVDKLMDLSNPEAQKFWGDYNKLKNVGGQTMWIQDRADQLLKLMQKPEAYVPQNIQDLMGKWWSGGYFNPKDVMSDPKKLKELNNIYSSLKDYDNMTYYVSQNIKNIDKDKVPLAVDLNAKISEMPAEKYQDMIKKIGMGDNDAFISAVMEYLPDTRLAGFIDGMYKTHDFGVDKNEFAKYVWSHIGKEITPKIELRSNKNFERSKWADQKKMMEKSLIHEDYKINTSTPENKTKLYNAALNGTLKATMENITGLGKVKTDRNGNLYQDVDSPELIGRKGSNSLKNVTLIEIAGNRYTPEQAKNYYGKYTNYLRDVKDDNGKVVGSEIDHWSLKADGLKELTKEEQEFVKALYYTGNEQDMVFNTQYRGGKVYQKSKGDDGKEITMNEDDFKDAQKVNNARPYGLIEADAGYYVGDDFIPFGKVIYSGDLTNDAVRSGFDAYYNQSNVKYNLLPGITEGETGNIDEGSTIIEF